MPSKETLQEEQVSRLPLKGKSLLPHVQRGIGSVQHVHPYALHIILDTCRGLFALVSREIFSVCDRCFLCECSFTIQAESADMLQTVKCPGQKWQSPDPD